jgi:hypothetical protein
LMIEGNSMKRRITLGILRITLRISKPVSIGKRTNF